MSNDGDVIAGFLVGAVLAAICAFLICAGPVRSSWELEAIKAGAAEYRINPQTFDKEFHWKGGAK